MKNTHDFFLIDDDPVFNFINESIIKKVETDSNIFTFTSAEKALMSLIKFFSHPETEKSYLIFLDINMPNMDGWQFLEAFNKIEPVIPNCKICMLSSSIDPNDIRRSKTIPSVCDFISKPLTVEKLRFLNQSL